MSRVLSSSLRLVTRRPSLLPPSSTRSLCGSSHPRSSLALRVHRSSISTPETPINDRQRVQQTWTLFSDRASTRTIEKLKIKAPGVTVVSWRPELRELQGERDRVVAQVRVSSDAREILESVDVRSKAASRAVVDFRAPRSVHVGSPGVVQGNLLTEIHVADARQLRSVAAANGADVVLLDDVLCSADDQRLHASVAHKLKLAAVDRSRLFVVCRETPINVRRLEVAVAGSGSAVLSLPSLSASNGVCMAVAGAGDIDVVVDGAVDVGDVDLAVVGDGRVHFHVHKHALHAADVRTKVAGAGAIRVSSTASSFCASQSIHIAGDGRVDLGDVATARASVHVVGDGRSVVQPQQQLSVANVGAATVDCIHSVPRDVELRGAPVASVRAVESVQRDAVHVVDAPTVETAFADDYVLRLPPQSLWTRLARVFASR